MHSTNLYSKEEPTIIQSKYLSMYPYESLQNNLNMFNITNKSHDNT